MSDRALDYFVLSLSEGLAAMAGITSSSGRREVLRAKCRDVEEFKRLSRIQDEIDERIVATRKWLGLSELPKHPMVEDFRDCAIWFGSPRSD
jgi:hypothetical protein